MSRWPEGGDMAMDGQATAKRVIEICETEISRDEKLFDICRCIQEHVAHADWVGFYLVDPLKTTDLVLGPFVGETTEHVRIPIGRGICGMAAERGEAVVVDDVTKETNYLSCSPKVRAEIVVPIMKDGRVVAELDIDAHAEAVFDDEVKDLLEVICRRISDLF